MLGMGLIYCFLLVAFTPHVREVFGILIIHELDRDAIDFILES